LLGFYHCEKAEVAIMTKRKSVMKSKPESEKRARPARVKLSKSSQLVHGPSETTAWEFSHHLIPPITSATTFRLGSLERGAKGFSSFANADVTADASVNGSPIWIYDRLDEPNANMLEEQLALLENAEIAVSFASGMGAIASSLLANLSAGQTVVAHRTLYGCTYSLLKNWLPKFQVTANFIDIDNGRERRLALEDKNVRVLYFESVSNPTLELANLPAILRDVRAINQRRSKGEKIITIVDNTFATPWGLRPLDWGVDLVVQSLTKNISGFGTEMGGAVMGAKSFEGALKMARKDFGATLNPRSAWHILVHGIPTLPLRFEKQQENALKIAKFLKSHRKVETVIYPGLGNYPQKALAQRLLKTPEGEFAPGTMICFTLKGDMKTCERFVDHLAKHAYNVTLAVSLGLTKTLIEVPGYMTHSAIPLEEQPASGLDPRSIRLSLGIENAQDIIRDLDEALKKI